ncbi:hypothetical protein DFJ77DRAFT_467368 [Powellomyces hirtus]|nr:hypothetical protein DFJ77DRAFT_467368 [Powellomyces hirtus]
MTTAPASFSGTEDASDMEVIPTGPILVISATGAILGQMTYEAAQEHVDPLTHQLRAVDTKQDPPVYRIIPLKAESSSGDFGSTYVKPLKNEKITASTVTVVDAETGETKGVMPLADALKLVPRKTHDLIMHLSAASEKAPTCQIISHEAQQKARAARKKPSSSSATPPQNVLKELEVGSTISQHDLSIKLQRARAFLEARHRLQFSIVDKKNRKSREILQLIVEELKDVGDMTSERVADRGRKLLIDFSPVPAKKKK